MKKSANKSHLELNRETLRALTDKEAGAAIGGITTTVRKSFCGVTQCYC